MEESPTDPSALPERIDRLGREVSALLRGAAGLSPSEIREAEEQADPTAGALRMILAEMRLHLPYDSASVQELRGNRLVIVSGVGFADLEVLLGESFEIDSADTPNGEVIYRGRPLVVHDTEHYRAFRRGLHVGMDIRSWLGVPLLHSGRLLGMLAVDKREAGFFTAVHQAIATQFASLAAEAMTRQALSRRAVFSAGDSPRSSAPRDRDPVARTPRA